VTYVIATGLMLAAILGGYTKSVVSVQKGILYEEVINVSGRQRMLSQRIVLLATRYADKQNLAYLAELDRDITTFSDSHDWLVSQAEEGTAPWAHYFDPQGTRLDARSRRFVELSRQLLNAGASLELIDYKTVLGQLEAMALQSLLVDLNEAVTLFEVAANQRTEKREELRFYTILAVLLMITLKAVFIVYPAYQQLIGMIDRLRNQAEVDALTGLANRRHFMAEAQNFLAEHRATLDDVVLIAMDLDGFKQINDTLGHPAGDTALRSIAARLTEVCEAEPALRDFILARPGGDEFLLLGRAADADARAVAQGLAAEIIAAVERPIPVSLGEAKVTDCLLGVSIGIAGAVASRGDIDALVVNADIALYESKQNGKGVVTVFNPAMRQEAERRNRWSKDIKRGLQNLEFVPVFQPQVEISTGRVVGLEALARWRHPEQGLIAPNDFVDQIEQARRTDALDGQIILQAVEALRACRDAGLYVDRMSVIASGASLRDPDFATNFADLTRLNGLAPQDFTVEVLESIVLENGEDEALASVQRLKAAGFAVAVDDFGTGYSSLESVALIGGSILKLDKSLVGQMHDPQIGKVLEAAIAMAHGLDATVYAEGVESEAHLQHLAGLGAGVAQGYLISRPVPLETLLTWLRGLHPDDTGAALPRGRLWSARAVAPDASVLRAAE
jgi:diguanylate cyclase (GGDEF)-like protein